MTTLPQRYVLHDCFNEEFYATYLYYPLLSPQCGLSFTETLKLQSLKRKETFHSRHIWGAGGQETGHRFCKTFTF